MAPKPPENNGENTNKKTEKQGKEDICENRPTNYSNGNVHDVGFCVGSDHHQEGAEVATENKVPVDGGAKGVVKSYIPVDRDAECKADDKKSTLRDQVYYIHGEFQHFHAKRETCAEDFKKSGVQCTRCKPVQNMLEHKENCTTAGCSHCKLVDNIRNFHKSVCRIGNAGGCSFCAAMGFTAGNENAEACTSLVSGNDETITEIITQVKGTPLEAGTKFVEGRDYLLEVLLGKGGNGMVHRIKLLESGKATLKIEDDNSLAVKIANVRKNEIIALQRLAKGNVPNILTHYFIVKKCQRRPFRKRMKQFEHLLFMQRAERSLLLYKQSFPDNVLEFDEAIDYSRQICTAVKYIHALVPPIVHNDIKSDNVLMRRVGDKFQVLLSDFEFASQGNDPEHRGTAFFKPPMDSAAL